MVRVLPLVQLLCPALSGREQPARTLLTVSLSTAAWSARLAPRWGAPAAAATSTSWKATWPYLSRGLGVGMESGIESLPSYLPRSPKCITSPVRHSSTHIRRPERVCGTRLTNTVRTYPCVAQSQALASLTPASSTMSASTASACPGPRTRPSSFSHASRPAEHQRS